MLIGSLTTDGDWRIRTFVYNICVSVHSMIKLL